MTAFKNKTQHYFERVLNGPLYVHSKIDDGLHDVGMHVHKQVDEIGTQIQNVNSKAIRTGTKVMYDIKTINTGASILAKKFDRHRKNLGRRFNNLTMIHLTRHAVDEMNRRQTADKYLKWREEAKQFAIK